MNRAIVALLVCLTSAAGFAQNDLRLLLQMDFEDSLELAAGQGPAQLTGEGALSYVEGKFGRALDLAKGQRVILPSAGNLDKSRGTICMWVKPHWAGDLYQNHVFLQDDLPFKAGENCMRLWHWCVGVMRLDVRDEGDRYITSQVKAWQAEQWHHLAATWDVAEGTRLYLDGQTAAVKLFDYKAKPSEQFLLGGTPTGDDALAALDDLRIYDRPLSGDQVRRVMGGMPVEPVEYLAAEAPAQVTVGEPFRASLRFKAPAGLTGDYRVQARLGSIPLGDVPLDTLPAAGQEATAGPLRLTIPAYSYPPTGRQTLSLRISGAAHVHPEMGDCEVTVRAAPAPEHPRTWSASAQGEILCDGKPWRPEPGRGLLVRGEFLTPADRDRLRGLIASGGIVDALPCRLVDEVDCAATDHNFRETAPTKVEDLLPGRKFRLTGEQEEVTQTGKRHDREFKVLPGFSYDLSVAPRPTPHVVVVESVDDEERYLEVAIDATRGSKALGHLELSGIGQRDLMNMHVTYNGREYEPSGRAYRESYLVFPKTERISVMITCSRHSQGLKSSAPAAVSHISLYEVTEPLRALPNPVLEPPGPKRSLGLFDPEIRGMFERYGFTDSGPGMRGQTLRRFVDYNRFLGFNRYEFRPFQLSERAYFRSEQFEMASDLDMFAEFLPLAREAGITVLPRVMYLHSYHKLLEDDPDNFQQTREGETLKFGREGPIPDPLRPAVQKVVMDSFEAMLEATKDYRDVVPGLCFDTSIGGVYQYRKGPSTQVGYSLSNVRDFCAENGLQLPAEVTDHQQRYDWLKANHWEAWLDWRARRWHDFVCALRDRVKQDGADRQFVLNLRIMPREEWVEPGVPLAEVYRECLYKPEYFREEPGVRMCWFTRVNADRYFGKLWWKDWFYDPLQPGLTTTPEPRGHEIYYNYWELPTHPWGFRVGPGSPVGRAFFEPYTHALRTMNPEYMLVFCWFRGSYGHEADLREWARAYRALPAVAPRDFEGEVTPEPPDERLWVKWFRDRLAVLNDSAEPREVTLEVRPPHEGVTKVFDANTSRAVEMTRARGRLRVTISLRPYDLRSLLFLPEAVRND